MKLITIKEATNVDTFSNKPHPSDASKLRLVRLQITALTKTENTLWQESNTIRNNPDADQSKLSILRSKRTDIEAKITALKQKKQNLQNKIRWG